MISKSIAQSLAESALLKDANVVAVKSAIESAANLGNYSLSYTFPVEYLSANVKKNLTLLGYTVAVTTAQVLAAAGSYTGQAAGMSTNVTIKASNKGTAGNITLSFDGVKTVSAAITAFNTANPSNLISLISGNGAQVPNNSTSIVLAGGVNSVAEIISIDFSA